MSIVTTSDFVGELTIAQVEQPNVAAEVQIYIDKYEPEYLLEVLGFSLKTLFSAGIALVPPTPIYVSLRDGGSYTDTYGTVVSYAGMKKAIANYIYFHYIRDNATMTTGSGEKVVEKGVSVSSVDKQVKAWNEMVRINKSLRGYIYANNVIYGDLTWQFNEMFHPINSLGL